MGFNADDDRQTVEAGAAVNSGSPVLLGTRQLLVQLAQVLASI